MTGKVFAPRFSQIPEELLDADVSDRAYRAYGMLHRYAGRDGRAFPGRREMADRLKCSLPTLDKALGELVETGFLWIEPAYRQDGGRTASNYHLEQRPPSQAHLAPPPSQLSTPLESPLGHPDKPTWQQEGEPVNESQLETTAMRSPSGEREREAAKKSKTAANPLERCAWELTRVAFERATNKPTTFPGCHKIIASLLRAGWSDKQIEHVARTKGRVVWTLAGLTAALEATERERRRAREAKPQSDIELLAEARDGYQDEMQRALAEGRLM